MKGRASDCARPVRVCACMRRCTRHSLTRSISTALAGPQERTRLHTINMYGTQYVCHIPPDLCLLDSDEMAVLRAVMVAPSDAQDRGPGDGDGQRPHEHRASTDGHAAADPVPDGDLSELAAVKHVGAKFFKQCLYQVPGWWVYELCFDRHLRQYHSEQTPGKGSRTVAEFFLGYSTSQRGDVPLTEEERLDALVRQYRAGEITVHKDLQNPLESFISFPYRDGTVCDISGVPRRAEVRFSCPTNDRLTQTVRKNRQQQLLAARKPVPDSLEDIDVSFIHSVEEPRTCDYVVHVYTSELCQFEGFGLRRETPHGAASRIRCARAASPGATERIHGTDVHDMVLKLRDLLAPLETALSKDAAVHNAVGGRQSGERGAVGSAGSTHKGSGSSHVGHAAATADDDDSDDLSDFLEDLEAGRPDAVDPAPATQTNTGSAADTAQRLVGDEAAGEEDTQDDLSDFLGDWQR